MWVALGGIAVRLIGTAIGMTESSGTSFKGADKLKLALGMVGKLSTDCQSLSSEQQRVMASPQVQAAMANYTKARVDLENIIARIAGGQA